MKRYELVYINYKLPGDKGYSAYPMRGTCIERLSNEELAKLSKTTSIPLEDLIDIKELLNNPRYEYTKIRSTFHLSD